MDWFIRLVDKLGLEVRLRFVKVDPACLSPPATECPEHSVLRVKTPNSEPTQLQVDYDLDDLLTNPQLFAMQLVNDMMAAGKLTRVTS